VAVSATSPKRSKIVSNLPPTPLGTSKNYLIAVGIALVLGGFEFLAIWRHEQRARDLAAAATTAAAAISPAAMAPAAAARP
jgi:hypothetical protein